MTERCIALGDRVINPGQCIPDLLQNGPRDLSRDLGEVFSIHGPQVGVDWTFMVDGVKRYEQGFYPVHKFTWSAERGAWLLPAGQLGT